MNTPRLCLFLSLLLSAGPAAAAALIKNAPLKEIPSLGAAQDVTPAFAGGAVLSDFLAPDDSNAYTCTFHWFRTPDGRIVGLDLIRSDDTGMLALRAYMEGVDGKLYGLNHETPASQWAGFFTRRDPEVAEDANFLGRGKNWISASVNAKETKVAFDLDVIPVSKGLGTGRLGLSFSDLVATDFTHVRIKGRLTMYGQRLDIDSPGITSVHYGRKLPAAAYVATVPDGTGRPGILLGAATGENLRLAGKLIGERSIIYAYGTNGTPSLSLGIGAFKQEIPLGLGSKLILSRQEGYSHELLGVATMTGLAEATLVETFLGRKKETDLGKVIFDFRGAPFLKSLATK